MFKPHEAETRVNGCPSVRIMPKAAIAMWALVKSTPTEIAWMATAEMIEEDGERIIVVDEVFLGEQTVHATEAEITEEGMAAITEKLITEDIANNVPEEQWRIKKLCCWGHSHVNMPVNPSGQDEKQALSYRGRYPWLLRCIANKKKELKFDLFWFDTGFTIRDLDWEVDLESGFREHSQAFEEAGKASIKAKVTIPAVQYPATSRGGIIPGNSTLLDMCLRSAQEPVEAL